MVLLPGCKCCGSECSCDFPDFVEVDLSYSATAPSASLTVTSTWSYRLIYTPSRPDDVFTAQVNISSDTFSNQTYRFWKLPFQLTPTGLVSTDYAFTMPGDSAAQSIVTISRLADRFGCYGRRFDITRIVFQNQTHTNTLSHQGAQQGPFAASYKTFAGPGVRVSCTNPAYGNDRSQEIPPGGGNSQVEFFTATYSPLSSGNSFTINSGEYPYYTGFRPFNFIESASTGPTPYSGSSGSVWPFTKTQRNAYRVSTAQGSSSDGFVVKTVTTQSNGFTKVLHPTASFNESREWYVFDFSFTVHGVRFGYGDTMIDFPSAPDYGPLS